MSWKDFFAFSRSEINGFIVFAIVLFLVFLSPVLYKKYLFENFEINPQLFKEEIIAFENLQKLHEKERRTAVSDKKKYLQRSNIPLTPFEFNPNHLSKESWSDLGMPDRIIQTIMNFEAAGGTFRFKEDLKRVYGINDEIYLTLEPFIKLPSRNTDKNEHDYQSTMITDIPYIESQILLDLNIADSLDLMKIRGIGPVLSNRIIRYRHLLGGFVSIYQLKEVYGIDDERFEDIKQHIFVSDEVISRININEAGFSELVSHPYINQNLANNLLQIRNQHGKYYSPDDLKKSHLLDDNTYLRISPYISFD